MKRLFKFNKVIQISQKRCITKNVTHPQRIFSAIQPTGNVHLGNYLGALKKWVELQNSKEYSVVLGIADLHSITIPKEPKELQKNILVMAATLLACGIDTNKSVLFQQSSVLQHTSLCWILATLATMAKLSNLAQFKDKCQLVKDPSVGLFLYPVLQAADIMLYRATHVPVGVDQIQQLYLAQHLVKLFNSRFKSDFPIPIPLIDSSFGKIKSLADPFKKMSKSDPSSLATITLMDKPDEIVKKIKRAVTDFKSEVTYEPEERPGVSNLVLIHSALTEKTPAEIVKENIHLNTGAYKLVLADVVIEKLKPIKSKIIKYLDSKEYLVSELEKGAEEASKIAEKNLTEVKQKVGLDIYKLEIEVGQNQKAVN